MKILVTGSEGFVGKNLIFKLENQGYEDIYKFDINTKKELLDSFTKDCDFVFHLAGVNRPIDDKEFMVGNFGFTSDLLSLLKKHNNKATILITSSIQAENDNSYGKSKKAGEEIIFKYGKETRTEVLVYRLENLFGKWSRPNYNTVVATYCHNIARDLEIQVNNPDSDLTLCYIDDVVEEFINAMKGKPTQQNDFCKVTESYNIKLGQLAEIVRSFHESRKDLMISEMSNPLIKKLYSTYLSFLPKEDLSYALKMNCDSRGSFTELFKTPDRGQVSINISKPGIVKGNHWHHSKNEKFLVVSGKGVIRLRMVDSGEVIEYNVSDEKLEVVEIPPGYTHSIENVGNNDMVTIMWANEVFDNEKPDTYILEVLR